MIKQCSICGHTGELTWRDGKYYCAMCGTQIAETEPEVQVQQPQQTARVTVRDVTCPICRNAENNQFDGTHYYCALCGTTFEQHQQQYQQQYQQQPPKSYGQFVTTQQMIQDLRKQKDHNQILGFIFIFLFWPAAIYFFYKAFHANQELKSLGYK